MHHGTDRAASAEAFQSANLVVTSYATAVRDASLLADVSWGLVYLDGGTKKRAAILDRFQDAADSLVFFISLKAGGTVEQKVLDIQEEKRRLAPDLIQEDQRGLSLASADELLALFE